MAERGQQQQLPSHCLTFDLHVRPGLNRGTAQTPIDQAYGVSLAECLQPHSTTGVCSET